MKLRNLFGSKKNNKLFAPSLLSLALESEEERKLAILMENERKTAASHIREMQEEIKILYGKISHIGEMEEEIKNLQKKIEILTEKNNLLTVMITDVKPSSKYINRYDVKNVNLSDKNLNFLPMSYGIVDYFSCSNNKLTNLEDTPKEVYGYFNCSNNKLSTLDHLPKYIGGNLFCQDNPFQNLNGLKDVMINGYIMFNHETVNELDYWIKALFNTDLDALQWHYNKHKYHFVFKTNESLKNYVLDSIKDFINMKRAKDITDTRKRYI